MDPMVPPARSPEPCAPPPSIVRQGENLSLLRQGFPLPAERCFRCNAPADCTRRKTLAWHHPAIYLTFLAHPLIYIIVALIVRKRASVEFGLCTKCSNRRILWICIWCCVLLVCIPLFVYAFNQEEFVWAIAGGIAFFAGGFGAAFSARIGYPKYIDDHRIVLRGSGKPYRDTFPEG